MDLESLLHRLQFANVTKTNNDWINFSCPVAPYRSEHNYSEDSNPSAGAIVGEDNQVHWHCFCCKSGGNIISLLKYLAKKEKRNLDDIISDLENSIFFPDFDTFYERKMSKIKQEDKPIESFLIDKLYTKLDLQAAKYLHRRGISGKTAKKLGLMYDPLNKRIIFPFIRNGLIYGVAGRTVIDEKPKIKNGVFNADNFFLGEHLWTGKPTILVEGLFAYAKLHEFEFDKEYDIAALGGTTISEQHKRILIDKDLPVYLFLDGDAAGLAGSERARKELSGEVIVYEVKYGEKKDIDLLTKDEISSMLQNASEEACV